MGYIDVSYQAVTFMLSVVLGAVICLLYDAVRLLHATAVKGFFEVFVCDILFFSLAAIMTFCFLVIRCQGDVRFFVLFGELAGFFLARITVSRLFIYLCLKIIAVFSAVFGFFRQVLGRILRVFEKISKKLLIYCKKSLQDKYKLLYNLLKVWFLRLGKRTPAKNKGE